jgi:signal transduction histidine kinase
MTEKIPTREFWESEEVLRVFFERSPDAILLIDIHDPSLEWSIIQCNEATWLMHGYEGKQAFLHRSQDLLCAETQDLKAIVADLREHKTVIREAMHRKQDGTAFPAHSTYTLVQLKGMEYLMVVEHDRADYKKLQELEDRFQAIFDNSPDGVVIINPTEDGKGPWLIEDCNKAFCEMNEYDHAELIDKDIRIVSKETVLEEELRKKYSEKFKEGPDWQKFLREEYYQKLKREPHIRVEDTHLRKDKSIFPVQASSCLITLNGQERVLGIDRDITEEKRLHAYIEDLRKDVGRTFHTFSATLLQVNHAIQPAIHALGPDPFPDGSSPTVDAIWKELVGLRNSLTSTLNRLLEVKDSPLQTEALAAQDWSELEKLLSMLWAVESIDMAELRAPILRRAACQVIDILNKVEKSRIRQELIRDVRRSAEQLERMTCLIALRQAQDSIVETDNLARNLRERVLTGAEHNESPGSYEFWGLVQEAVEGLSEYASYKEVAFRKDNRSENSRVWVVRSLIVRAVNNLLNNAIKYSWSRGQNVNPWIEIRSYVKDNRVCVEIEDYGVPIPKDEIEKGLIFQFGHRGRLSGQRGRVGTGIGLADARDMARRYGGEVSMDSRPAPRFASPDDLLVPHIKTAVLSLPIFKRSGDKS